MRQSFHKSKSNSLFNAQLAPTVRVNQADVDLSYVHLDFLAGACIIVMRGFGILVGLVPFDRDRISVSQVITVSPVLQIGIVVVIIVNHV